MRLALSAVVPVEVWDLPVGGKLLQEHRFDTTFPMCVAEVAASIRDAPPASFSERARALARSIEHVYLTGGGADEAIERAIRARGLTCTRSMDPFAAVRAGLALRPGARVADIGQSGIKLACGERTWRVERDLERAPLRDSVPQGERDRARASTVSFIGEAIAGSDSVLVALPCEIADDGVPRSCSYCWHDPDPELVADLEAVSGASIDIVNDAELAALSARLELGRGPTLVLTIGFGVGGALLP